MAIRLAKVSPAITGAGAQLKANNCKVGLTGVFVFHLGIYFAKHATYADRYSKSSMDPLPLHGEGTRGGGPPGEYTKIIFLARVVIGKSNVGQPGFIKPDRGRSVNAHHSCVDDAEHPKVFVVFDPNQIYPEYLIQYK